MELLAITVNTVFHNLYKYIFFILKLLLVCCLKEKVLDFVLRFIVCNIADVLLT